MAFNVTGGMCKCRKVFANVFFSVTHKVNFGLLCRSFASYDRDPAPYFFKDNIQQLMKNLTKKDSNKIFRALKLGDKLRSPAYKFLTSEQLQEYQKNIQWKIDELLQIPPIVKVREEINEVLSTDPALKGYDEAKFVFTDITFGIHDRDRIIVVRDPDGVLREATWDERFRMNQIYFPQHERHLRMPHMFEEKYLMDILDRGDYEFVLDRACNQFEPDDPEYHRVTSTTYDHIDKEQKYEVLQSTRHFGAMCFYLCWNKRIDNFLLHCIQEEQIDDGVKLIKLYYLLQPNSKFVETSGEDDIKFIQTYIDNSSERRSILELALRSFIELQNQRNIVEGGIKKAHGL